MRLFFLLSFVCSMAFNANAQLLPVFNKPKTETPKPKPDPKPQPHVVATATLKFTTDATCKIYIDGAYKAQVEPDGIVKVNLPRGEYRVKYVGDNTADFYSETLTIEQTGTEKLHAIELQTKITERQQQEKKQMEPAKKALEKLLGLDFVLVTGGSFKMGSNDGIPDEKPIHTVSVNSFYMSKTEVTQAQWKALMGNNPSEHKGDDLPVEKVSWHDAVSYCQKLSEQTGRAYRLPTEAEWEYAARGGNKSLGYTYSGSNSIDEVGWYTSNCSHSTQPVGKKQPNELGLYDMTGNVWEWCNDWYDEVYYSQSPSNNPHGPSTGIERVFRGASVWNDVFRVTVRGSISPDSKTDGIGFRVVFSY